MWPLWRSHLAAGRAAGGGCDEIITTSSTLRLRPQSGAAAGDNTSAECDFGVDVMVAGQVKQRM